MRATEHFKRSIQSYLHNRAAIDDLFAEKYSNPSKNIDDCITYILNTVKQSGCYGFTDEEIFSMAIHYYTEGRTGELKNPAKPRRKQHLHRTSQTNPLPRKEEHDTDQEANASMTNLPCVLFCPTVPRPLGWDMGQLTHQRTRILLSMTCRDESGFLWNGRRPKLDRQTKVEPKSSSRLMLSTSLVFHSP